MKKSITMTVVVLLLTVLACSTAWSQDAREVWIGGYLLLRVRCPAGGYSIAERVAALQERANILLGTNKPTMKFSVKKFGTDANIYADATLFMTVTPADAKTNGTTSAKLADVWAARLRDLYPKAIPSYTPK